MSLSVEEGARKLYALFYGEEVKPKPKRGRPRKAPAPIREHQFIGMASLDEIKERVRLRKDSDA